MSFPPLMTPCPWRIVGARSPGRAALAWLLALLIGGLLAGCGGSANTPSGGEDRAGEAVAVAPTEPAATLLPTPTLAAPSAGVTADPLRPPTPVVLPSATPLGNPVATPDESPGDAASPADVAVEAEVEIIPTVALPPDATAPELFELGNQRLEEGDYATAAAAFAAAVEAGEGLTARQLAEAHLGHGVALLEEGQVAEAAAEFEALLQDPAAAPTPSAGGQSVAPLDIPDVAAFQLGRARAALGEPAAAIEAFRAYAQNNPDMAAYVQPLIADAHQALGDTAAAIAALEAATAGAAQRFKAVENRGRLADLYLAAGDYPAAIAQYDAIHDIAQTEATKGQMAYLAGQAELLAGDTAAAHERFLFAVNTYPRAATSHAALIALVEAGAPVDDFQRGVVDYYAEAYAPGVEALRRYLTDATEAYNTDAHLFLAWNLEGLGDVDGALAALDDFAAHQPVRALFERAELLARAGRGEEALAAYDEYLATYPDPRSDASITTKAAALADELGRPDAIERYVALADSFPFDDNAPRALFRAAELTDADGDAAGAVALWQRLAEQYPANVYGAEALFHLLRLADSDAADELNPEALAALVETLTPSNYFALRAADFVAGVAPFAAEGPMSLPDDASAGRDEAETWLRERLPDDVALPAGDLGALSPELAAAPQRLIGEKLWQLGLREAAKAELETFREAHAAEPLANYQLALYFGELGLFRSSIVAAASLLQQMGATVFDAPRFLGRLSYPVHYADLILPLADQYGYDPRLQFALVRQESLFESFARSGAAAQGLSQVIPDTGAWIAQRLAWPDFENDDLYKPYVGLNFGAYYLSQQLAAFDGHVHAALAAYNGGPGNAARWFDAAGADHDRFVDTVDFPETRLYIERIYEGFNAYRHLYTPIP